MGLPSPLPAVSSDLHTTNIGLTAPKASRKRPSPSPALLLRTRRAMRPLLLLAVAAVALAVVQAASPGQAREPSAAAPLTAPCLALCSPARPAHAPGIRWRHLFAAASPARPAPATAAAAARAHRPAPAPLQGEPDSRRFVLPMDTGMPAKAVWPELVRAQSCSCGGKVQPAPPVGAGALVRWSAPSIALRQPSRLRAATPLPQTSCPAPLPLAGGAAMRAGQSGGGSRHARRLPGAARA